MIHGHFILDTVVRQQSPYARVPCVTVSIENNFLGAWFSLEIFAQENALPKEKIEKIRIACEDHTTWEQELFSLLGFNAL